MPHTPRRLVLGYVPLAGLALAASCVAEHRYSPPYSPPGAAAPEAEPAPEALMDARLKRITQELASLANPDHPNDAAPGNAAGAAWAKEWAGTYYVGDGLGMNVTFALAPGSGFVYTWYGCMGLYDFDHGEIAESFPDGVRVKLVRPPVRDSMRFMSERLYFVPWGHRKYLVPEAQMLKLVNDYNRGGFYREALFDAPHKFIKPEEVRARGRMPNCRPTLPEKYAKLIVDRPISFTVTKVTSDAPVIVTGDVYARDHHLELEQSADGAAFVGMEFALDAEPGSGTIQINEIFGRRVLATMTQYGDKDRLSPPIVGLSASFPGAQPKAIDWASLTLDDLIDRLPPAGDEWRPREGDAGGLMHPAAAELESRLRTAKLSSAQWERAVRRTGAVTVRSRWPKDQPFRIGLAVPRWLGIARVSVVPDLDGLRATGVGDLHPGLSGTFALVDARDARFRAIGDLPQDAQSIGFEVTVERGTSVLGDILEKESAPRPAPGVLWKGTMSFPVSVCDSIDAAVPPVADPSLDEGIIDAIGAGFREWGDGKRVLYVVADPDAARFPALAELGLSLEVDLLQNGKPIATRSVLAANWDGLLLMSSGRDGENRYFGSANFELPDPAIETDEEILKQFSFRIKGTSKSVLPMWHAKRRWAGELTIPLADAIFHEYEICPSGRGPEASTPSWK